MQVCPPSEFRVRRSICNSHQTALKAAKDTHFLPLSQGWPERCRISSLLSTFCSTRSSTAWLPRLCACLLPPTAASLACHSWLGGPAACWHCGAVLWRGSTRCLSLRSRPRRGPVPAATLVCHHPPGLGEAASWQKLKLPS